MDATQADAAPVDVSETDADLPACVTNSACSDGNACTVDTCVPGVGCVSAPQPASACADSVSCTVDACAPLTGCVHTPQDSACPDGDACNADTCDVVTGCNHVAFPAGTTPTQCDDGDACTTDTCDPASGCAHSPVDGGACEDGLVCTADTCVPASGCVHLALDLTPCDDGDACTSPDRCIGTTCQGFTRRWELTWPAPAWQGQWLDQVRRPDGTHTLIGWQVLPVAGAVQTFAPALLRVQPNGTAVGPLGDGGLGAGYVITSASTVAGQTLVQGLHFGAQATADQPWYGWLGADDLVTDVATFESPAFGDPSDPVPLAVLGLEVTPTGEAGPVPVWFAVVTLASDGKHHFVSLRPGQPPVLHPLGSAGAGCTPTAVADHLIAGSCTVLGVPYVFHATFDDDGVVGPIVQTKSPLGTILDVAAVTVRANGHRLLWTTSDANTATPSAMALQVDKGGAIVGSSGFGTPSRALGLAAWQGDLYAVGAVHEGDKSDHGAVGRVDAAGNMPVVQFHDVGVWLRASADEDGLWLLGGSGKADETVFAGPGLTGPHAARVDAWGFASCTDAGKCLNLPTSACDDGNTCTTDNCAAASGCKHADNLVACEDGNPCSTNDHCKNTVCTGGLAQDCNDASPCTDDACTPGIGCTYVAHADGSACFDGNSCTHDDICASGLCVGTSLDPVGTPCNGSTATLCSDTAQCVYPWASAISVGSSHTCAVGTVAGVRCWGDNSSEQLGILGDKVLNSTAADLVTGTATFTAGDTHIHAGTATTFVWTDTQGTASAVGSLIDRVTDVKQNWSIYDLFIDTLMAMDGVSNVQKLVTGDHHGCAELGTTSLVCWGSQAHGQTGVAVAPANAYAQVVPLANVVGHMAAGGDTTCVVESGNLEPWCFGAFAALWGSGNTTVSPDTAVPTKVPGVQYLVDITVGNGHACGIKGNGVWCWGDNTDGQIGTGSVSPDFVPPKAIVNPPLNAVHVAAGDRFTCALTSAQTVRCWGAGTLGQLGDGKGATSATPVTVAGLDHVTAIGARANRACALRVDGSVWCWGAGDGTTHLLPAVVPASLPTP